ncbi:MAG: phosphotransferase [Pirellulales bacterium]
MFPEQVAAIASCFAGLPPLSGLPIRHAAAGLSGAEVWRVTTSGGGFALKAWPNDLLTTERPEWIARQLRAARDAGEARLPVPLSSCEDPRHTCVRACERWWQCEPWLPGKPELATAADGDNLAGAMAALAQLHAALRTGSARECRRDRSPAIARRRAVWNEVNDGGRELVRRAVVQCGDESERTSFDEWSRTWRKMSASVDQMLQLEERQSSALQVVHGDMRADHVLFEGGKVSGFIDFAAATVDSVALDMARLLSDAVGGNAQKNLAILNAYAASAHSSGGLSVEETVLVDVYARSAALLSPYRWFRWIHVEKQEFADSAAVALRRQRLMNRLREIVEST